MKKRISLYGLVAVFAVIFSIAVSGNVINIVYAAEKEVKGPVLEDDEDPGAYILQQGGFLKETEVRSENGEASAVPGGKSGMDSGRYPGVSDDTVDRFNYTLEEAIDNREAEAMVSSYEIELETGKQMATDYFNNNPDFFCASVTGYSYYTSGNVKYLWSVKLDYHWTQTEYQKKVNEYNAALNKVKKKVNSNWSDMEKVLFFNDYLAELCEYEMGIYDSGAVVSNNIYNVYGVFVEKKAVCQGYALAFKKLCNLYGIECHIVSSDKKLHAWNMVKLDGSYFMVDVTSDDPVPDRFGGASHRFFLKSKNKLMTLSDHHNADDMVVTNALNPALANDTSYDTYFWDSIDTSFEYINGMWYSFDGNNAIYSYSCDGTDWTVGDKKVDVSGVCWYISGESGWYTASQALSVSSIENLLIYTNPEKILFYNTVTGRSNTMYTPSVSQLSKGKVYGVKVTDGVMRYGISPDPNADGEFYEIELFSDAWYESRFNEIISSVTTPGMSDYEKLYAVTQWLATNTDYGSGTTTKSLLINESGSCVASTSFLLNACALMDIPATKRSGAYDSGSISSDHVNVMAKCDGKYYIADAGFIGTRPRGFYVEESPAGFTYAPITGGYLLVQYDGFENDVELPSTYNGNPVIALNSGRLRLGVTSLTVPASITSLGESDLNRLTTLESVTVDPDNQTYSSENGCLLTKDGKKLLVAPKKNANVIIPSSVTEIGGESFYKCSGTTSISIPDTVTKIEEGAFDRCSGTVYYQGSEEQWNQLVAGITLPDSMQVNYSSVRVTGVEFVTEEGVLTEYEETKDIEARVLPENASNKTIVYSLEDNQNQDGHNIVRLVGNKVTALNEGTCKIVATSADGNFTATLNVIVRYPKYKIKLDGAVLDNDDEYQGLYEGEYIKGKTVNVWREIKEGYKLVGWQCDQELDFIYGSPDELSDILVFYMPKNDVNIKAVLEPIKVSSISWNLKGTDSTQMRVGTKRRTYYSISPQNALNKNVTYESADDSIATVDENGVITAVATGKVKLTVRATDGSGAYDSIEINVVVKTDDDEEIELNHKELHFYKGSIICSGWTKTRLRLLNFTGDKNDISWSSSNDSIVYVDDEGNVTPVKNGRGVITATYNGKEYKCQVDIKDVRFYVWHEYPGEPQSSRWVWNNVDLISVGQTIKYKFVELTYDEQGNLESEKDVTDQILLEKKSDDYLKISNGTMTALKNGANQENEESKLYYYFKNTNVDYDQYIFMNIFTTTMESCNKETTIVDNSYKGVLTFKSSANSGFFTLDDQFMHSGDWFFYKCKNSDIIWKTSDESVIKFNNQTGCTPNHIYSQVEYEVLKTGKATISVYYRNNLLCQKEFEFININSGKEDSSEQSSKADVIKAGTIIEDTAGKASYKVTKAGAAPEVEYKCSLKKNAVSVVVPETVKIGGVTYKVTSIAAKAFYKNKKLKKITIPASVVKIGKQAFFGCKNLKTITIKTKKLTSKSIGAKAFKGTHKKARVKTPAGKSKAYKKILRKKGLSKKAKVK